MPRSAAISLPRLRIAMVRSRTRSATGIPISAATSSNVIGSSCSPIFTPSTKAPLRAHDEPMTLDEVAAEIGMPVAERVRDLTIAILKRGNEIAADRGILLADTKVEFGFDRRRPDADGYPLIVLADELLTSSASGWDRSSGDAPPALPDHIVEATRSKYVEAYESLTGQTFA